MQKLFRKILVPVNFNLNTGLAMDKAIQIANHFACDIHILHVQTPSATIPFLYDGFFSGSFIRSSNENCVTQLKELEERCKRKLNEGLLMSSAIILGSWQSVLKQTIITEHIDLVLIPKGKRSFGSALIQRIDMNELSQQTQCPILTVTRSFNIKHLQNIVVPINDSLPVKKLTIATYLCKEAHGSIHLMGIGGKSTRSSGQKKYLIKAYQLLSDFGHIKIHCSLPENSDNPYSTLSYARNIKADLIVVSPGKESLLKGWWNRLLGKYLYKESNIPVLTVSS